MIFWSGHTSLTYIEKIHKAQICGTYMWSHYSPQVDFYISKNGIADKKWYSHQVIRPKNRWKGIHIPWWAKCKVHHPQLWLSDIHDCLGNATLLHLTDCENMESITMGFIFEWIGLTWPSTGTSIMLSHAMVLLSSVKDNKNAHRNILKVHTLLFHWCESIPE